MTTGERSTGVHIHLARHLVDVAVAVSSNVLRSRQRHVRQRVHVEKQAPSACTSRQRRLSRDSLLALAFSLFRTTVIRIHTLLNSIKLRCTWKRRAAARPPPAQYAAVEVVTHIQLSIGGAFTEQPLPTSDVCDWLAGAIATDGLVAAGQAPDAASENSLKSNDSCSRIRDTRSSAR